MHPPRDGDLDIMELTNRAFPLVQRGLKVYLKWTCPSCGERVMSDDPLELVLDTTERTYPKGTPVADMYALKLHRGYMHTAKDNGDPCMISVQVHQHKFGFTITTGDIAKLFPNNDTPDVRFG